MPVGIALFACLGGIAIYAAMTGQFLNDTLPSDPALWLLEKYSIIVLLVLLLVVAGNETTRQAMTLSMKALMDNPDQMQYFLDKWLGGISELLIGIAYVALVLYLPYGIVGTWRVKTRGGGWRSSPLGRLVSKARA